MIEQILQSGAYTFSRAPHQFVDLVTCPPRLEWLQALSYVGSRIHLADPGRSFDQEQPLNGPWKAVKRFSLLAVLSSVILWSTALPN